MPYLGLGGAPLLPGLRCGLGVMGTTTGFGGAGVSGLAMRFLLGADALWRGLACVRLTGNPISYNKA